MVLVIEIFIWTCIYAYVYLDSEALIILWCNLIMYVVCSSEAKPVLGDSLSEFANSLLAAYDSGELFDALNQGKPGWQNWVKSFGKSVKRKVSLVSIFTLVHLVPKL